MYEFVVPYATCTRAGMLNGVYRISLNCMPLLVLRLRTYVLVSQIGRVLAACDAYCLPSIRRRENVPLIKIEKLPRVSDFSQPPFRHFLFLMLFVSKIEAFGRDFGDSIVHVVCCNGFPFTYGSKGSHCMYF